MKINRNYVQWLVFWLSACLPFAIMAAAPLPPNQEFLFTEPEFETLEGAETIANQAITALAQDTRGLIWIGTQSGLIRYDGYRFRRFARKTGDPFSLVGDYITSLSFAKDGRLWIGTISDGISVFDPASERFENFQHDEKIPDSLSGGTISALAEDGQGGMWIATDQGLDHLSARSRRFVHFRHNTNPHSLMDNKVRSLLVDKSGRLWVGGGSGLQQLSQDGKSFKTVVKGRNVLSLFQAQDGKLWLGTREHGAAWLKISPSGTLQQAHWLPLPQLSNPFIFGIAQVKTDQIWLATFGGGIIIVAASNGNVLQTLRHDPMTNSLALDEIRPLLLDRAGLLWVGTWGSGLQRMNVNNTMLRVLRHSPKRPNGLSNPDVRSLLELSDGRLLIGSNGNGIDIFDKRQGLIGGYRPAQGKTGGLPDSTILALAQTRDGSVWAGTQQAGVVRQLSNDTAWVAVPGLPSKVVYKLLASRDGSLWAGTDRGVAHWVPEQAPQPASQTDAADQNRGKAPQPGRFKVLVDEQGKAMEANVSALAEDQQGRVWIGTQNGLWLYKPGHSGLIHISAEPNHPDGLVSGHISGLLFDSRNRLWLATDKGLERLKSLDGKVARFEHISALSGQTLGENLMEDRQGRIWTGEAVIDPAIRNQVIRDQTIMHISRLTPTEGMDLGATWNGSYTKTRSGLLLFGGVKGVAIIDPTHFKAYNYAPPMVITELKFNGVTVAPQGLINPSANSQQKTGSGTTASLTLAPEQRNFSLEFAALDYLEPKKNRYQYRLQGYEKDWISTDSEHRSASYGNLWPGSYILQVRGSNRLGDWSTHELNIPIRVLPAWWQTWWFGTVLLLSMCAFIAALVQTRTHYLHRRQHELEQLVAERTAELREKQVELVDANAGLALSVETLRQLSDIGREITTNLDAEIVFKSLYLYVGGLLNAPTMTIYRMNSAAATLDGVFGCDEDKIIQIRNIPLDSPTSNAARAVRERQELLLHYNPLDDSVHIPGTRHMLTALFGPLIVGDRVLGVMSIQSDKQNVYGERERLIFRTLSAYGAIALANADAIAALSKAQGQLVQQEKMASLGGLVAGIAHEINTPLGTTLVAISGAESAWQTLQNAIDSGRLSQSVLMSSTSEGLEYTSLALRTASRAAELIALFKTVSVNADSDRPMTIELAHYLEEVATLVHAQLAQNGCKLELETKPGLSIHIVPEALTETLSRVLVNVVNHAFDEGRTGTLRLCAQAAEGDEVVITVSDDGHGIAPENLPKVFDPFYTTKGGMHGHVGLGLHVAYNHVTERLKGKIQITSTLGKGTCVEIRLKEQTAKAA